MSWRVGDEGEGVIERGVKDVVVSVAPLLALEDTEELSRLLALARGRASAPLGSAA
jgi:hypothetical protein